MKLNQYLDDIKSGCSYNPIEAGSSLVFLFKIFVLALSVGFARCVSDPCLFYSSSHYRVSKARFPARTYLFLDEEDGH
jgi:hypothetical protein